MLTAGDQAFIGKSLPKVLRSKNIGTRTIIDREGIDIMPCLAESRMKLELAIEELRSIARQAIMSCVYDSHLITDPIVYA